MEKQLLEAKLKSGASLYISLDTSGEPALFFLDCGFSRSGFKVFDELPRVYRTERGARQAGALLACEKLVWVRVGEEPIAQPPKKAGLPPISDLKACPHCGSDTFHVIQRYKGVGGYHRSFSGALADNTGMYDGLNHTVGKTAYCSNCRRSIARWDEEADAPKFDGG